VGFGSLAVVFTNDHQDESTDRAAVVLSFAI
jgi:hypothetical protein